MYIDIKGCRSGYGAGNDGLTSLRLQSVQLSNCQNETSKPTLFQITWVGGSLVVEMYNLKPVHLRHELGAQYTNSDLESKGESDMDEKN